MQPVIIDVIDAAKTERRAHMTSLARVVIDDIENYLDAGGVQVAHHRFEFDHLLAHITAAGVFRLRREKSDRVVAPVVDQTAID